MRKKTARLRTKRLYKERHLYYFECTKCKKHRQTFMRARARRKVCRKCRSDRNFVHPDQLPLLAEPVFVPSPEAAQ